MNDELAAVNGKIAFEVGRQGSNPRPTDYESSQRDDTSCCPFSLRNK